MNQVKPHAPKLTVMKKNGHHPFSQQFKTFVAAFCQLSSNPFRICSSLSCIFIHSCEGLCFIAQITTTPQHCHHHHHHHHHGPTNNTQTLTCTKSRHVSPLNTLSETERRDIEREGERGALLMISSQADQITSNEMETKHKARY